MKEEYYTKIFNKKNKLVYKGMIKNGQYNGKGQLYDGHDCLLYEGEFKNGYYSGTGIQYGENGHIIFSGIFKMGKPYTGTEITVRYHEGSICYKGGLKGGSPSGYGSMYAPNGTIIYEGEFKEGLPNGKGKRYNADGGLVYEGQFKNDKPHGIAKEYDENGKLTYYGNFDHGIKIGPNIAKVTNVETPKAHNRNNLLVENIKSVDETKIKEVNMYFQPQRNTVLQKIIKRVISKYRLNTEARTENYVKKFKQLFRNEISHNICNLCNVKYLILDYLKQMIDELNSDTIKHCNIVFNAEDIVDILNNGLQSYYKILYKIIDTGTFSNEQKEELIMGLKERKVTINLTHSERVVLRNCINSTFAEYYLQSDFSKFDVGAVRVILEFCYRILQEGISSDKSIYGVVLLNVDTNDKLLGWKLEFSDEFRNLPDENIVLLFKYNSLDELDNFYNVFENKYVGLSNESMKMLATAMYQENEYNKLEKSKEKLSYTGVAIIYFGVIEKELTRLICILQKEKYLKKLMWKRICDYLKQNKILYLNYKNYLRADDYWTNSLIELNKLRNKAAHGGMIEYDEFKKIRYLAIDSQLLEMISWLIVQVEKYGSDMNIPDTVSKVISNCNEQSI